MADKFSLQAQIRTKTGRRTNQIRRNGLIPAVIYGHGVTPQDLEVGKVAFEKLYRQAGESSLVDLKIADGGAVKVLIQEIQMDPLRADVSHVDFRQVRMDEKLEAEIVLNFVDESPAVKELGGVLLKNANHIKVRCLPGALVHEIEVSLVPLKTFADKIHVSDIKLPEGMEVLNNLDEVVAMVEEPRSEAELAALESTPEVKVEDVKVATDEKKAEREKEKEETEGTKGKE